MKTQIRRATSLEFQTLLAIDQSCFPPGVAYDAPELDYFMRRRGAETLVAEIDGAIVAFMVMDVDSKRHIATLITLDVQEAYRRRGVASSLLAESEKILLGRGVRHYLLQVDQTNTPAIGFYNRHNFQKVRSLKRYYPNGADAYLMVKNLH